MLAVDWRKFLPLVRMSAAQCPVSAMLAKLREAAREFCSRARVWVIVSEATDILAGESVYGLRGPTGADVCGVLSVRHKGRKLKAMTPEQWSALPEAADANPTCFTVTEPGLVHLYPRPTENQPGVLFIEAVVQPSLSSAQAPEFLLSKHGAVIAQGALARLMLIPDRPWTDPNLAAVCERKFEDGIAGARIVVDQGGAGAQTTVKYRPFF